MATISQIRLSGTTYPVEDGDARSDISTLKGQIGSFTVGKNVPADAVFTDTTYDVATTSDAGLMSATDKTTLDNLKTNYDNLVKDAPGAYDTLKEISDYIATHKSEYEALEALVKAPTFDDTNERVLFG